jgi:hypothetical protein
MTLFPHLYAASTAADCVNLCRLTPTTIIFTDVLFPPHAHNLHGKETSQEICSIHVKFTKSVRVFRFGVSVAHRLFCSCNRQTMDRGLFLFMLHKRVNVASTLEIRKQQNLSQIEINVRNSNVTNRNNYQLFI